MKKALLVFVAVALIALMAISMESIAGNGKEIPICIATGNQENPAIYGDLIVWMDSRNRNWNIFNLGIYNWDIYMYDLKTNKEIPICTARSMQKDPAIYEDMIVWTDCRDLNGDVYMYDLKIKKEVPIYTAKMCQSSPAIYKDKLVWKDNRYGKVTFGMGGEYDIFYGDLKDKKEIPICTIEGDQFNPAIYEDMIVWQDNRNGNWDIYMYEIND